MTSSQLVQSVRASSTDSAASPEQFHTPEFLSVQHLVETLEVNEGAIPSKFLRVTDLQRGNLHSQPMSHTEDNRIPIIDMKALAWTDQAIAVGQAFEKWGFCVLVNHGIPLKLMQDIQKASLDFFGLPLEKKLSYRSKEDNPFAGALQYVGGPQNDWRDALKLLTYPRKYAEISRWPEISGFRELLLEYTEMSQALACTMYELVSESLGLEKNYFAQKLGHIGQVTLIPYYPRSPSPQSTMGNHPHSDTTLFTFVFQNDVGGLQVLKNGSWIDCKPIEGSIIVNCGDVMQAFTNAKYRSVYHRVLSNIQRPRLSILSFIAPLNHVKITPIPELLDKDNPAKYPTLSTKEISQSFIKDDPGFRFLDSIELKKNVN